MDDVNVSEILEKLRDDTSLLSRLDIDKLIGEHEGPIDLENKTLNDIINTNNQILSTLELSNDDVNKIQDKLSGYKYIDNLYQLQKGRYIRWLNKNNNLTNGAIVADIMFMDNGIHIMCKNSYNKCFKLKFDNCVIFQKLTPDEEMILLAYEYVDK